MKYLFGLCFPYPHIPNIEGKKMPETLLFAIYNVVVLIDIPSLFFSTFIFAMRECVVKKNF